MINIIDGVKDTLISTVPGLQIAELDAKLQEDMNISSLALVSTITKLCEEFDVNLLELTDSDLVGLVSVKDIVDLFERYTNAN